VEAALKTAMLATGKPGVIAFTGAYHGTGYGALNATHREHFRGPFRNQLREFGHFVPFPKGDLNRCAGWPTERGKLDELGSRITRLFRRKAIGAILAEPIQVRGGIQLPDVELLNSLRLLCDQHGALLILDEIYTGFGRTGKWFACEHFGVVPDLICLGKALTGGFPLSACVGRADLMDAAWPVSSGEAIHTSTYLGHPVGCAMALAQIEEIDQRELVERSARLGDFLLELLEFPVPKLHNAVRGVGLLVGMELRQANGSPATETALRAIKTMLRRGYILLPEGEHSNVISFTPPLTISRSQLAEAVAELKRVLTADKRR
jgi:4-aminobutyrate aminotransferase-like enzyme